MKKEIPLKRSSVIPLCRAIAREGQEVQVRHQKRQGGQHGDLRGKGRQVMTHRLSERPENSSGSLVARITLGAARNCNAPSRRGHSLGQLVRFHSHSF